MLASGMRWNTAKLMTCEEKGERNAGSASQRKRRHGHMQTSDGAEVKKGFKTL